MKRLLLLRCLPLALVVVFSVAAGRAGDNNKDELFSQDKTADVVAVEQVFSAYVYLIDSRDGERLADLFLPDGVDDHFFNDGDGNLIPTSGVGGGPCVLRGRDQIKRFVELLTPGQPPLPFPGHSHHVVTSRLIKVDGDTATMKAVWFAVSTNDAAVTTFSGGGEYDNIFKRTAHGWKIARDRVIFDRPVTRTICDANGPTS